MYSLTTETCVHIALLGFDEHDHGTLRLTITTTRRLHLREMAMVIVSSTIQISDGKSLPSHPFFHAVVVPGTHALRFRLSYAYTIHPPE